MSIDKTAVIKEALKKLEEVLQGKFELIAKTAPLQLRLLTENALIIKDPDNGLNDKQRENLHQLQIRNLQDFVLGTKALSIVAAEQAAEAVWEVIINAIGKAITH
ncbi:hypothetical protein [Caballeronia zhejiangensis]|uniref:hypothetical protein n=1 Tax=Caballeronia zhejiangensis TaxID=871203 RepID=UPI001FD3BE79|nr:hypothetical protein [Caballeronia zhejiangensis]